MKIPHLTANTGNVTRRNTRDVALYTLRFLEDFEIEFGSYQIRIPNTMLMVNVTHQPEGTIFDISKNAQPAIMNICKFDRSQKQQFSLVTEFCRKIPFLPDLVREPSGNKWLASIIINPFILSQQEMQIAGEVEFYIWYKLYQAFKNQST